MNKPPRRHQKSPKKPLELMHTDLVGPIDPKGLNGELHAQLLSDDFSGAMWVSTLPTKSGATDATRKIGLHSQKLVLMS